MAASKCVSDKSHEVHDVVITLAGTGCYGYADGPGKTASFANPEGITVDREGNVIVADTGNLRIRKVTLDGTVTTIAGSGNQGGHDGEMDKAGSESFNDPEGVAVDQDGNLIIADAANHSVRKVFTGRTVERTVTICGTGYAGFSDGPCKDACFNDPKDVAIDSQGDIIVADTSNHRIRKISQGVVSTLAGSGTAGFQDGSGEEANFADPESVAIDALGNIYVADTNNHSIRKITPEGEVTTLAGMGVEGYVDGPGVQAKFHCPEGVAVDGDGNVIVADTENHRIRMVRPDGQVSTIVGGDMGFADGALENARFHTPTDVSVDGDGKIVVLDYSNFRIRLVSAGLKPPSNIGSAGILLQPPSSFRRDMLRMLSDPALSDISFEVDGQTVSACRALIMARSEYFYTMLNSDFLEGKLKGSIPIQETTKDAFLAVLQYLYTDEVDLSDGVVLDVLRLAHRYHLPRLCQECCVYVRRRLNVQNAVSWWIAAKDFFMEDVTEQAFDFVKQNFKSIRSASPSTLSLLDNRPELMKDLLMNLPM
mmetsp:Transcript_58033/g.129510  ORF Transcript_58033/g.129510 Transcript_58033/m.129510 type:complete len:538 (-) Transcript_58033:66-1679(-)